ncbi:OLC1v1021602C1 [Oldenlandia corymbosa var. corymbosa]|uniref:OLC1v1021602C1 n=1 Tax=Oldenlandia corymbosa var. corymbosa TaxID=529605 RepID=A0AAV1BW14_OLDCO|nr:OLC1v1021602C1 [Oldenlandia corymbosa var. corymbosa]
MASLSTATPGNSSTLSSLPKSSPFFTKISQLPASQKRSNNHHHFRVACQAKDNDQNPSRRNVLLGLGGLYGAASLSNDPFSFAAPIPGPDVSKCGPADLPEGAAPTNCCPPSPSTIVDFQLPSSPTLRIRPAAHLASRDYIAKYNRAIQLMKALPDNDPRSFRQQANVHCAYCDGAYDQAGFPNLELQVHGSWLFLPFHRFYLYFFEKICGKLLDDPTFAMPFWNYDAQGGMSLPAFYADRNSSLYNRLRDAAHQPPNMIDLNFGGRDSNLSNSQKLSQNQTIMYRQIVSNARSPGLFFGGAYRAGDDPESGAGSVEITPHGPVHVWTGDRTQPNLEDMGNFYSAARDPIFYAHHSNIDRMWNIWKTLGGRRQDITDPDWLNASFLFYDENAQMVRVRVRDCLDTAKLGYQYQDVAIPWLNSRPSPRVSTATRMLRRLTNANAADNDVIFPVKLDKPVKVMVKRPSKKKRSKKEKDEKDEILVIQKIVFERDQFVKFDVYINDEDDPKSTPENTEFAGSFVNVPHRVHSHENQNNDKSSSSKHEGRHKKKIKTNLKLSLTEILEDMDAEDDDYVAVTLVPRVGCDEVTVGGMKIELD